MYLIIELCNNYCTKSEKMQDCKKKNIQTQYEISLNHIYILYYHEYFPKIQRSKFMENYNINRSQDSSVSTATGYKLDYWAQFLAGADFSLPNCVQTSPGAHQASYLTHTGGSLYKGKVDGE